MLAMALRLSHSYTVLYAAGNEANLTVQGQILEHPLFFYEYSRQRSPRYSSNLTSFTNFRRSWLHSTANDDTNILHNYTQQFSELDRTSTYSFILRDVTPPVNLTT